MSPFQTLAIEKSRVKRDLVDFQGLLNDPARVDLKEREDILPFFKARPHLSAFLGRYNANITDYGNIRICHEFDIFGDHVADLAIGDAKRGEYCFIEFEDASEASIFKKRPKMTPEWSSRFEHGFSQIVDWILWIENNKGSAGFRARFDAHSIRYNMLLVIGRDRHLAHQGLRERLTWRNDGVSVMGKTVNCITYDKLFDDLSTRLEYFTS